MLFRLQSLLLGLVAAVQLDCTAAEAPLAYHYPAPGTNTVLQQTSTAAVVNEGISADKPAAAAPGYVSPSLLVASTPPAFLNYQPQYNGDYQVSVGALFATWRPTRENS